MEFTCATCGQIHSEGLSPVWDYPLPYLEVPEHKRVKRCFLTTDTCVIDDEDFFVRGCLEIPVIDEDKPFVWGVWTSLSRTNFFRFEELYDVASRSSEPPMFGWFAVSIPGYPETLSLKTMVHLRDDGMRPFVELEPTDHPLAIEQRNGIDKMRVGEICEVLFHQ